MEAVKRLVQDVPTYFSNNMNTYEHRENVFVLILLLFSLIYGNITVITCFSSRPNNHSMIICVQLRMSESITIVMD